MSADMKNNIFYQLIKLADTKNKNLFFVSATVI
jgi:hypothetical protein